MGLISNFKSAVNVLIGRTDQFNEAIFNQIGSGRASYDPSKAETISTIHTCIKILSETLGRLPLGVYQETEKNGKQKDLDHYLYPLLRYNPNGYTTSNAFITALEVWRNLRGNAYALINRISGSGKVKSLEIINPDRVQGYNIVKGDLYYKIKRKDSDEVDTVSATDILHFKTITKDGVMGINPIEALRLNLSTSWEAMGTIDEYYKENGVQPKAIKSTVSGANQKAMLEALNILKREYQGKKGAGQILPLPPNTEIQELQMNAIDVVFLQMIEFNANQIAALFGIPSHLVGNMTTSKYNSIEQTQLSFKVNTMSAITRMYRQEFEFKLLTTEERNDKESIEFNLMALVETDHKSRLEGYRILANIGALKPNKIATLEGLDTYPGGDDHYIQTNMMSVEKYNAKNETPVK